MADGAPPPAFKSMISPKEFAAYILPILCYCALIFIQSGNPAPDMGDFYIFPGADKLLHFFGYAVLGALFARAYLDLWLSHRPGTAWILAGLSAGLYGMSDEFHQSFVSTRSADPLDFAADCLGGLAGAWAWARIRRKMPHWLSRIDKHREFL